jgi:hypothetical protein
LNASGLITLLAPDGTVTVSHGYGFQIGAFLLDTGVARSGTWHVQIRNDATTAGTLGSLSFKPLAIDDTIDLGGSASYTARRPNKPRLYLIRPGTATAVAYKLTVAPGSAALGATVSPMGATIDGSVTTGRRARPPTLAAADRRGAWTARCGDQLHPERDRPRGRAARRRPRHHLSCRRRRPHLADRRLGRARNGAWRWHRRSRGSS